jgi:hypothetical protein
MDATRKRVRSFSSRSTLTMVAPMRSKALLSQSALLKARKAAGRPLPITVADLDGCALVAHCDCCGRHFQLYPGPAAFGPRTRLASLLNRLSCSARRMGEPCGSRPRRLVLVRDECQWVLDSAGEWTEDTSVFWEQSDFDAVPERLTQALAA